MATGLGFRPPEAVKALEVLQQQERAAAGEPSLTPEDFRRQLKENIQLSIISDLMRKGGLQKAITSAVSVEKEAQETCDALVRSFHLDDETQWSRYEMAGTRYEIAKICARIEAMFSRNKWPLPGYPVVGTLTTGRESATTQPTSAGNPLILIDNGFFKFAGIMSQLAVFASYDAQVRGGFSEATLQLLCDLIATHTVLNTCLYTYPRTTPDDYQSIVANFQRAVSIFVISHEYAHIFAGDFNAHPAKPGNTDISRHEKELKADQMAFFTTVEIMREDNEVTAGIFGPIIYLAGLDVLARAAAAYEDKSTPPLTDAHYPTPYERMVSLLKWIEAGEYRQTLGDDIREASRCYQTILFAWDNISSAFIDAGDELSSEEHILDAPRSACVRSCCGLMETREVLRPKCNYGHDDRAGSDENEPKSSQSVTKFRNTMQFGIDIPVIRETDAMRVNTCGERRE